MIGRLFSRFLAALCLLTAALPVLADAGAVQFVSGEVRILHPDGRETVAIKGTRIREGDTVITGGDGHAQLAMADEALLSLRPDTSLRFDAYRYGGREDGSEKGILGLIKGGFRTLTGLIGRSNRQNYQVRTPTATIGIRGTDHEPFYIPPAGWSGAPGVDPGTYDRVISGATFLETEGGRLDLEANQVGFVPPDSRALPARLERMPDFMRAGPAMRGPGGDRRGSGEGPGRGDRRAAPPPSSGGQTPPRPPEGQTPPRSPDGQMPISPPGGLPPRSGDTRPVVEPVASDGSFGFNQAVAQLTAAPQGTAVVGGDRSVSASSTIFGSGAGIASASDLDILLDAAGQPAVVADRDGFRYARSGARLALAGGASLPTESGAVEIKWGIYAGGTIVDSNGPRAVNYFHFMTAAGTPTAIASHLSGNYNALVGSTQVITELGVGTPSYNMANTRITLVGGELTYYKVDLDNDGFGRAWSGVFAGSVPVSQFVQSGVRLSGSGPGGNAAGNANGAPVGPAGQAVISGFDLKTATSGITGSFAVKNR